MPYIDMSNATVGGSSLQAIPHLLRSLRRWITWKVGKNRLGKLTKLPVDPGWASPARWLTFEEAITEADGNGGGLAFVMSGGVQIGEKTLYAMDLDACRDPLTGLVEPWAADVVRLCGGGYTEITPSGSGLRPFVLVAKPPAVWARQRFKPLDGDKAPNSGEKQIDCQVFGVSRGACFVTVTGDQWDGTGGAVGQIEDLSWWPSLFGRSPEDGNRPGEPLKELPVGLGEPPTKDELLVAMLREPRGRAYIDADVDGCLGEGVEDRSPSRAYFEVVRAGLKAANEHGRELHHFLMTETVWGVGGVKGSAQPGKYADSDWVANEIKRIAGKVGSVRDVFSPIAAGGSMFEPLPVMSTAGPAPGEGAKGLPWVRQTLADLLSEKSPPWVVQHYMRLQQVGVLGSAPGVGKSTLVAAWMMSVLHGEPWCGKKVRGGSVLALVGENRRGFANSLDAFARHHGFKAPEADRYLEIVDFKLPLSSADGQAAVKKLVEVVATDRGHAPTMVVIDTLSSHWAESEDSSEFMAPAMRALLDLAQRWNCVVIVVHHITKARDKKEMPTLNDLRGSGAVGGNTDFAFGMCAPEEGVAHVGELKVKNDVGPAVLKLHRVSVGCGVDAEGEPVSAGVFENTAGVVTKAEELATRALENDIEAVVAALAGLGHSTSKEAVVEASHMRAARGRKCFAIALDRGWIENRGTERTPNYFPGKRENRAFLPISDAGKCLLE
jgi:hypothetical protein